MPKKVEGLSSQTEQVNDRVLLIDLENCPSQIQQLMKDLEQYSQVVICYAQSGAKIPIDRIVPLTATVNNNRLRIAKMPNGGKNAADFGITFWAGVMMAGLPSETHFTIMSNDTDLDHVVNLLKDQSRSAERIGAKKDVNSPHLTNLTNETVDNVKSHKIQQYCSHLVQHNKNRPAKKETLINNIKSKFKEDDFDSENFLTQLIKASAIVVKEGNKIAYNESSILKLAKV